MNEIDLMADSDQRDSRDCLQQGRATCGPRKFWGTILSIRFWKNRFSKKKKGGPINFKFGKIGWIACFERSNLRTEKFLFLFSVKNAPR